MTSASMASRQMHELDRIKTGWSMYAHCECFPGGYRRTPVVKTKGPIRVKADLVTCDPSARTLYCKCCTVPYKHPDTTVRLWGFAYHHVICYKSLA